MEAEIIPPALVHRLQVTAAIDAINKMTDLLTDEGCDNYLSISHRLIAELENDSSKTMLNLPSKG